MIGFLKGSFTTALTIAFLALCWYAWQKHPPAYREVSLGEFAAQQVAAADRRDTGVLYRAKSKVVYVWRDAKAAAIADALSLTPDSVDTRLP